MASEAQKKATKKYTKEHYKRIPLNMQKTDYEKVKKMADKLNMSVNGFIKDTILDKLDELEEFFKNIEK